MDFFLALFAAITVILGYSFAGVKIVKEGNQALVERLGKYNKKLKPGLNFIIPLFDSVVVEETLREKVLDIEPQNTITKDNVSLKVDAVIYWQIMDLEKTFYTIEDIEDAIENLVLTNMRSAMGELFLKDTYSSRKNINEKLLNDLDEATGNWGVKINRVEIKTIEPIARVMESLEEAENKKRTAILEAEEIVHYLKSISQVLEKEPNASAVLQFLLAKRYVEANEKFVDSPNSKVLFMDPKALNEALYHLMSEQNNQFQNPQNPQNPPPQNPNP